MIGRILRDKKNIFSIICFLIVIFFFFIAITAPLLTRYDPNEQNLMLRLKPPFWFPNSVSGYILGTDDLGRDLLSRIIYGSRVSMLVGVLSVILSGFIGVVIGLLSGYFNAVDKIAMRIADIQLAFPSILLALAIVAVIGGSLTNVILVIGITGWVSYARVVRSEVLSLKTVDFVIAAQTIGASEWRILLRHILPNILAPIITIATFQVAGAIVTESSLSFLGLGVPPNIPTWGNMLSQGQLFMDSAWWITVFPGLCIMLMVFSINILGDFLRDYMDPKSRTN